VLTLPAWLLTRVAGPNVRKLRPDRLIELSGKDVRVGVYPYDIAISSTKADRIRLRAAILSALATSDAHLTTSAEGQAAEESIRRLGRAAITAPAGDIDLARAFETMDRRMLALAISSEEWDLLYRQRLEIELTYLRDDATRSPLDRHDPASEPIMARVGVS